MNEAETPAHAAAAESADIGAFDTEATEMDIEMEADEADDMEFEVALQDDSEEEVLEAGAAEADEAEIEVSLEDASEEESGEEDAPDSRLALSADTDAQAEQVRMLEALLFAAAEPLDEATLAARLPAGADVKALVAALQEQLRGRGVELVAVANGWRLQTPAELAWLLEDVREERRKLSAAARETLAIIAYHQPVTRAEIEEIRGVAVSKGTVDLLMELGWVRMRGRRRAPGRPVTYGTTDLFLSHFGLEALEDLPGKAELKAAGLLDSRLPPDFSVPTPGLLDTSDEEPLEGEPLESAEFHVDFLEESEEAPEETPPAQAASA